jgi:hypothetical protein
MDPPICLELLFATICAWAGLWGCLDELVQNIESAKGRFLVYFLVLVIPLVIVTVQNRVSVCSLL